MTKIYFLNDPHEGYETFKTEAERDKEAALAIERYLDDGWDEEVANVECGVITHVATQTDIVRRPDTVDEDGIDEEGDHWLPEHTHRCNYKMLPVTDGA